MFPVSTMLAITSSSESLAASTPVFLHVGAETGKIALDYAIKIEEAPLHLVFNRMLVCTFQ